MGKKVKKKHSGIKHKQVPTSSPKTALKENKNSYKIVDNGDVMGKERELCAHFENAVNMAKVSSKLESVGSTGCEGCRSGKGKGKNSNKKKVGSNPTWMCLHCGHFSCGSVGLLNSKKTHSSLHANQTRHPLIIQMDTTKLLWCFSCTKLIRVDNLDDNDEQKVVLSDIIKLLEKQSSKTTSVDVEDVWFGSGSVNTKNNSDNGEVSLDFYAVRGLSNLGNTCFFNSVIQNLLAVDTLRDYLLTYDGKMGPVTCALKKIFVETSSESGVRNVINPNTLFGCICAKASQFKGYQQQDSHELLRCLLDCLATEDLRANFESSGENLPILPPTTFIDRIFGGKISNTVCCVECGHSSVVQEPFLDLSLPIPTKKTPPKKTQPACRTKKSKLPPKRPAKHHPRPNKDPSSSSESSSTLKGPPPGTTSSKVSKSGDEEDGEARLDYSGLATQTDALVFDSWLDYLEPISLTDDPIVKIKDVAASLKYGENDCQNNHTSEEDVKLQSTVDNSEDGRKLQVQDDELIVLKDKEESVTPVEHINDTEISSLTMGDEEDSLGFFGLGDLFDEPEPEPAAAESDHDDIDNTDSVVSVESCLAHFVKSELLSGEHAWHCENCSKKLQQEERRKLKNQQKFTSALQKSTSEDECSISNFLQVNSQDYSDCSNSGIVADSNESKEQGEIYEPKISCSEAIGDSVCPKLPDEDSLGGKSGDFYSQFADQVCVERQPHSEEQESGEDEGDDGINLNNVKAMRSATKRTLINESPTVLTIHLKRFAGRHGHLSKLKGHVVFNEYIDLQPYVDNRTTVSDSCIYRLLGVVEHSGSMRSGHYVAYVRGSHRCREKTEVWYHASDVYVRETTLEEVLRSEAYILFYEKILP